MAYCASRFRTFRRPTVEVKVGSVGVGGSNPIRIQSMTTSDTQDVAATVRQSIALAEVGCEIVRITAPNVQAARCLRDIRSQLSAAGFPGIPLVADIHFLPQAAMEAIEHVEKVRVNPGNYADKKKFAVREYSDADYERELQRLHEAFSPLVLRAKALGRSLRIGTNHGSLSDRIMNRYGDTPLGMVESALEFLRIAESHGFRQLVLSMKSSNPKVMIQAYRLLVERMQQEDMHYPLHLGVTEAGDGEDGRIKSAIGIGSLLLDGLGDTIRVSLTEDSVYEIPVARALAEKAMTRWHDPVRSPAGPDEGDDLDLFHFTKRPTFALDLSRHASIGPELPPRVIVPVRESTPDVVSQLAALRLDTPVEGLLSAPSASNPGPAANAARALGAAVVLEIPTPTELGGVASRLNEGVATTLVVPLSPDNLPGIQSLDTLVRERPQVTLALALVPENVAALASALRALPPGRWMATPSLPALREWTARPGGHAVGVYRQLARELDRARLAAPLWIRNQPETALKPDPSFLSRLLEAAVLTGSLLCDGLGDVVSIETEPDPVRSTKLAFNVLQGAGARITKTEFVACPSCGRTLFDLQSTTQRIRAQTGHLKGVKIAIMGCIVNGPGEMADADFGYVGGAPGKINLYVGKNCVQYNIPQSEADARLIALIREHGKWVDPVATA